MSRQSVAGTHSPLAPNASSTPSGRQPAFFVCASPGASAFAMLGLHASFGARGAACCLPPAAKPVQQQPPVHLLLLPLLFDLRLPVPLCWPPLQIPDYGFTAWCSSFKCDILPGLWGSLARQLPGTTHLLRVQQGVLWGLQEYRLSGRVGRGLLS